MDNEEKQIINNIADSIPEFKDKKIIISDDNKIAEYEQFVDIVIEQGLRLEWALVTDLSSIADFSGILDTDDKELTDEEFVAEISKNLNGIPVHIDDLIWEVAELLKMKSELPIL